LFAELALRSQLPSNIAVSVRDKVMFRVVPEALLRQRRHLPWVGTGNPTEKEKQMSKPAMVGAVLLALAAPLPAFAQAAVSEPGMASFYHPNADILHSGIGGQSYRAPLANAPPYAANAYAGGPAGDQAYAGRRPGRPLHPRSRVRPLE
jgi:hypothetical protein